MFVKKSLIIGAALVACMVVLTLLSGLAQAQGPASPGGPASPPAGMVDPTQFYAGVCTIGPQLGDVLYRCFNLGFTNSSPWIILCQPRNAPEQFVNLTDQFACHIIGASLDDNGSVWFRIRRLDLPGAGWDQNLQINLLVIDHG
jgi:hypothetical protein